MVNKQYCCRKFLKFTEENQEFLNNPLIKNFLSIDENFHLFKQSICHPTIENQKLLDKKFNAFYFYIRFTTYLSSTIYYHALNFDKKSRQTNYRFPVILDQPVGSDSETSHKELVRYHENFDIESANILDYIIDTNLYRALQNITTNQRQILYLVYIKGFTDTEVSILLKKSQQTVTKSRNNALQKIRRQMAEKVDN
ncbi:MAG TPA: sigma-70 family RNA polymerase sigma factor [Bacillales bacterium]|nr:sigma-70 family RNA polymerase sigma factor [Bacillales bacterium]